MTEKSSPFDGRDALPIYLGPALPRWQPRSIADVESVLSDGTLRERHWLDVKAEVGSSDGSKKELARDLCSFANDGGGLVIGVREDKPSQTLHLSPVELNGLSEQVDQVARSRCNPPLYVVCHPLAGPGQADGRTMGVLLVEIPPSPSAPHMTDGRYYGRADTTRYVLQDVDVARLHAVRSARQLTASQVIASEMARDPVPVEARQSSHLYVVAQPLASPPDLLTPLIGLPSLRAKVLSVAQRVPKANTTSPSWSGYLTDSEMRAVGQAFCSYATRGRQFKRDLGTGEEGMLDVEVQDDGTISLFCGRASYISTRDGSGYVSDNEIVVLTRCLVTLAGELGRDAGYAGRWMLAMGVTDLLGKQADRAYDRLNTSRFPEFSADVYVQGTEVMTVELLEQPGSVTGRLVSRLLRALGVPPGSDDDRLSDAV